MHTITYSTRTQRARHTHGQVLRYKDSYDTQKHKEIVQGQQEEREHVARIDPRRTGARMDPRAPLKLNRANRPGRLRRLAGGRGRPRARPRMARCTAAGSA